MKWVKENWGALLFFTIAGLSVAALIYGLVVKTLESNERTRACVDAGYIGYLYIPTLRRNVCYGTLVDGQSTIIDVDRVRED